MKKYLFVLIVNLCLVCSVVAQGQTKKLTAKRKAAAVKESSATPLETQATSARRRVWLFMSLSNVFDTNVLHDEENLTSFGFVPSVGLHVQDDAEKPSFEADYEIGFHRYTKTTEFNRVSHYLAASYRHQLTRKLQARTTGEISLKGSSEDRDINNQYSVEQQLQYRFNANNRVRVFGAYRLKRYPLIDIAKNAIDPYVGAKFEQKLKGSRGWEINYRYDKNRSQGLKDRYVRWTYGAQFNTPIFKEHHDQLTLDVHYAPRLYARQVKIDGVSMTRRDKRWVFDALYERPLSQDVQLGLSYRFETRNSNDPDKNFNSHLFGVTFAFKWWR